MPKFDNLYVDVTYKAIPTFKSVKRDEYDHTGWKELAEVKICEIRDEATPCNIKLDQFGYYQTHQGIYDLHGINYAQQVAAKLSGKKIEDIPVRKTYIIKQFMPYEPVMQNNPLEIVSKEEYVQILNSKDKTLVPIKKGKIYCEHLCNPNTKVNTVKTPIEIIGENLRKLEKK